MKQSRNLPKLWGLLPSQIRELLKRKEWDNVKRLKALLNGTNTFPIQISLKAPRGHTALEDMTHFQLFVNTWKHVSAGKIEPFCTNSQWILNPEQELPYQVVWEKRRFRHLGEHNVPVKLEIQNIQMLAAILGKTYENQLQVWHSKIKFIMSSFNVRVTDTERKLFNSLINNLEAITKIKQMDLDLLMNLIPQLNQDMGKNCYLRALPIVSVDTKFVENNLKIIESLLDALHNGSVSTMGLFSWLNCKEKPKDWLLIKPLCDKVRSSFGRMPLLRLSSDTLFEYELPAKNILIVENEQSCLALPDISDCIAVAGGGKNVSWLKAKWLASKYVAYWGDIDSEGFIILSDVRSKLSNVTPLMMDFASVEMFESRMVQQPDFDRKEPICLTEEELKLFRALSANKYQGSRLEQERIPLDYVKKALEKWLLAYF